MEAPISYVAVAPPSQWDVEGGHLKTLAICHYVWGGLTMAVSCIALIYVGLGVMMLNDPSIFGVPRGAAGRGGPTQQPPPDYIAHFFIGLGLGALVLGWTVGILTIFSGRCIAGTRRKTFSLIMAGVNCLSLPIGTTLGVFTFILLLRPSIQARYRKS